ncbi:MAG: peptidase M41 [Flavobacteriales bacterium]|nr:peptidase M41 [Flavobacteriales bacterium]
MQSRKTPSKKVPQNNSPIGGFKIYWIYGIIAIIFLGLQLTSIKSSENITETEFLNKVENNDVKSVTFVTNAGYAEVELINNPSNTPQLHFRYSDIKDVKEQIRLKNSDNYQIIIDSREENRMFGEILSWILPLVLFIGIWILIMRRMGGSAGGGGQIFNIGKSKAKLINKEDVSVNFNDVAGLEGAKEEITEIVDFLKSPQKYTKLGGKIPRGAMLIGPPGTGKTLLAKAVAGEAKVPFFSLSGSDFVEMFVGVGASRVRDLFKQAKEKAPSIIFIDEIDAIGRARGKNSMTGGNDERENTLNQLLTEMDGFGTNTGVIVMAATNRADVLDKALIRPGRFDRQIYVDLPDLVERKAIFEVHLKPLKLSKNIDRNFLARQTPGFSGADIANVCNESALIAARKSKKTIGKQDFLDAMDRIIGGMEKKSKIISPIEKQTIAYHEAGHATVSWMLQYASPLVKVTIVPRGKSLGAAWYLPEERQLTTTQQLEDEMCAALGGRAAEEIFFGKISTGALSDLEKVTKQAYAMISIYGMSKKIGNISYYDSSGQNNGFTKPYSEERAKIMDNEVTSLVETQYERAKKVLLDNKEKLEKLANSLLENEVIFKSDLEKIFGERKWKSYEEEKLNELDSKAEQKKIKQEDNNGEKLD